ncbi:MAG: hypothetical protein PHH54_00785 [Candidatus Nanoarchaeia archaeon]|nr:hypothetical protein [Candidatus Nanoarchaeia archaeon]MDD5740498.1 hypothetical protein [Candidatus Nanoarchaeia archaeon]
MDKEGIDLLCEYDDIDDILFNGKTTEDNSEIIEDMARLDQTCFDYNSYFYSHLKPKHDSNSILSSQPYT